MKKTITSDIDLRKLYLTELFDLSDVEVIGSFNCSQNDLISINGAPKSVT